MRDDIEIRELAAQPAAIERAVTDPEGLTTAIDRSFAALFARLAKLGVPAAGPPFTRYLETGGRFKVMFGVPVSPAAGELERADRTSLPAGRAAVLRYVGPYEGLPDACERLRQWIEERGEEGAGPFWEAYVTDPRTEPDASKHVTEIYQPLR